MLIQKELNNLNELIIETLSDKNNNIASDISDYLSSKSKRIRPSLVFLFTKALGFDVDEKIYHLACAVELIHNSTLVHDDILDDAQTRRGKISLNYKLGNSLSVLAGDILLSIALKELVKCSKTEIIDTFSQSLYLMCKGEINQNFAIGKLPTMNEYIKKSEYKTAELFKAPLVSLAMLIDNEHKINLFNFAQNFGIAFQIKDDLMNILKTDPTKPIMSDIDNGIYTAPVIFLNEQHKNIESLSHDKIKELIINNDEIIKKTQLLIKQYVNNAIESIDFIKDNEYKQEIIRLTNLNL
ncbi:polyprenyl synthetase family protein [bacterium]|nr:polyprenyl synthetase family protein [bacterium]